PFITLLILATITLASMLVFSFIGLFVASIIFDVSILSLNQQALINGSPEIINAFKVVQVFAAIGTFGLPVFVMLKFLRKNTVSFLQIKHFPKLESIIHVTVLFLIMFPFLEWLIEVNSNLNLPEFMSGVNEWMRAKETQMQGLVLKFLEGSSILDLTVNLIVIALIPALTEELFFRGLLQNLMHKWVKNIDIAIILTAIFFSAVHLQFLSFLPRVLLGVLLGYFYFWTKNLWVSIYFHFLNNSLAVIFVFLANNKIINYKINEPMEMSNWVTALCFGLAAALFIYLATYYSKKRDKSNDWKKVYATSNKNEAEIIKGKLENEGISAVILNKRDSSIPSFGTIEIRTKAEELEKAMDLIRKIEDVEGLEGEK
ncbi:MAG: CPBP family glutamic-type intramembrane protease, partial [Bacteroidota bacterium]|nr:CPBP family glutamic-type intramembrane protease [Bacteroidota bacterium]